MDKKIEVIVRMVILSGGNILLCKQKTENYYFLPGGHVDFEESVEFVMQRELREEVGVAMEAYNYIGTVENIFSDNQDTYHEINLVFEVKLEEREIQGLEDHLEFHWKDIDSLSKEKILPIALKENLIRWFQDKRVFWGSQKG